MSKASYAGSSERDGWRPLNPIPGVAAAAPVREKKKGSILFGIGEAATLILTAPVWILGILTGIFLYTTKQTMLALNKKTK